MKIHSELNYIFFKVNVFIKLDCANVSFEIKCDINVLDSYLQKAYPDICCISDQLT